MFRITRCFTPAPLLFLLGRLGSFRVVCRCYLSQQDVYSFGSAFLLDVTVVYYNKGGGVYQCHAPQHGFCKTILYCHNRHCFF